MAGTACPRETVPFPVAGEISHATWDQIIEGQPVLLRNGGPAAVIIDLKS